MSFSSRYRSVASFVLFAAVLSGAKMMQAATSSTPAHIRKETKAAATVPPSNATSQPATITLKNGLLTVNANDSDLTQILKEVVRLGGMTMDGTIKNYRVFGAYGPGTPRDVLTSLLTGSGYNFIMVGNTHDGVPRELVLSVQNGNASSGPNPGAPSVASVDQENSKVDTPDEDPPGPGAIVHVPPSGPEDPRERSEQNLQRLTHMREQQTPQ